MSTTSEARTGDRRAEASNAACRAGVFALLSAVFRREPGADLIRQIKQPYVLAALAAAGADLDGGFLDRSDDELAEELAVEYAGLFIGPGGHIPPYASVHLTGGGDLWGSSTVGVRRFIEQAGFEYRSENRDPPDHLSVELDFMRHLAEREARALEDSDGAMAARCKEVEAAFVTGHLALWIPRFCARIVARAEEPFYRVMATLLSDFIGLETGELASGTIQARAASGA